MANEAHVDSPALTKAVTEVFGLATADVIARATEVQTFRIDAKNPVANAAADAQFGGYPILARGPRMGRDFVERISARFMADRTYAYGVLKDQCPSDVGVGLRFEAKGSRVDLLLRFPCARIVIAARPETDRQKSRGEYFDPARREVQALVKEIFPADAAVQALE